MYSCTPGYNKSGRRGQLCCPSVWGPLVPRNNVTVSIWQLGTGSLLWGGAQQRRLTQGRGSRGEAPWQGSLPVQKRSLPDNLFPFICFNLSSDQAGSPLIISVIPLLNPRQQICFSKVSEPELDWKKKGGKSSTPQATGQSAGWKQSPIVFTFLSGPKLYTTAHGKFWKGIWVGNGSGEVEEAPTIWSHQLRRV